MEFALRCRARRNFKIANIFENLPKHLGTFYFSRTLEFQEFTFQEEFQESQIFESALLSNGWVETIIGWMHNTKWSGYFEIVGVHRENVWKKNDNYQLEGTQAGICVLCLNGSKIFSEMLSESSRGPNFLNSLRKKIVSAQETIFFLRKFRKLGPRDEWTKTYVPMDVNRDTLLDFSSGRVYAVPRTRLFDWSVRQVKEQNLEFWLADRIINAESDWPQFSNSHSHETLKLIHSKLGLTQVFELGGQTTKSKN